MKGSEARGEDRKENDMKKEDSTWKKVRKLKERKWGMSGRQKRKGSVMCEQDRKKVRCDGKIWKGKEVKWEDYKKIKEFRCEWRKGNLGIWWRKELKKEKGQKVEKQNRISNGRWVQRAEYRKGESLLLHVAADVLTRKRKLKLSRVMTLILGEPLIIDQDHSCSELISFHTLEPCKLMSNNRLRTGQLNITILNTGSLREH